MCSDIDCAEARVAHAKNRRSRTRKTAGFKGFAPAREDGIEGSVKVLMVGRSSRRERVPQYPRAPANLARTLSSLMGKGMEWPGRAWSTREMQRG